MCLLCCVVQSTRVLVALVASSFALMSVLGDPTTTTSAAAAAAAAVPTPASASTPAAAAAATSTTKVATRLGAKVAPAPAAPAALAPLGGDVSASSTQAAQSAMSDYIVEVVNSLPGGTWTAGINEYFQDKSFDFLKKSCGMKIATKVRIQNTAQHSGKKKERFETVYKSTHSYSYPLFCCLLPVRSSVCPCVAEDRDGPGADPLVPCDGPHEPLRAREPAAGPDRAASARAHSGP